MPWQVFADDPDRDIPASPASMYFSLPCAVQEEYLQVSLMEWAAYAHWLDDLPRPCASDGSAREAWGALDEGAKAAHVPAHPVRYLQRCGLFHSWLDCYNTVADRYIVLPEPGIPTALDRALQHESLQS